jgi:threonine/homoserine/homoserine lactone efflux protein
MNLGELFLFSFLVALTGAMSPGPLLTFTIYKTLKSEKRGYLIGLIVTIGHATIEFILILLLLAGASIFLQNIVVIVFIALIGGSLLSIFGILIIRDVIKKRIKIEIDDEFLNEEKYKGFKGNNFLGGILVSLSNPYWWIWWISVGLVFMVTYNVSINEPFNLLMFFLGHEMGDLIWYLAVSIIIFFSGKVFNYKVFNIVLICCGAFMIGFGLYLAIRPLIIPPTI